MKKQLLFFKSSIIALLVLLTFSLEAATFTVSNLNNTGAGSLRQAISSANGAGGGGHTIDFSVSGVISLNSHLPVITNNNVTIDGAGQTITVSANGGDISRYVFRGNAGADFLTVRNLDIKNTGYEPFRFDGSPTDVTIENIKWYNEFGNYLNYGIHYRGNALNLTVKNVIAEDHQNYNAVIEITGTATNLMVDNLTFDNKLSNHRNTEVIRIGGAATNCTFQNCNWDLDNGISGDDGNYGIYFYSTVTNSTIKNVNILNCEYMPLYFRLAVNGLDISNLTTSNGDGYGGAYGIYFNYPVTNLNMDTVVIDMDHTNSTNDGDYGIFFRYDAINVDIDSLEIHDGEIHNMYIGRTTTNFSMKRATFDNFDGYSAHQSLRFQGNVNNLSLTDVVIDGDITGTANDGDYGIWFNSANVVDVIMNNVTVNDFDGDGIRFYEVDDLLMNNCKLTKNYDGMEFYHGHDKSNNIIKNSTFSGSDRAGLLINVAHGTNQFEIDSNTFSGNQYGVWLHSSGGVKDIQIRNNIIFDNSISGIYNERADGVLYSQNSIYNNTVGIDNYGNDGNNGLTNPDGDVPALLSSVNVGGGNYDVTFNLPAFCNTSDCDVEIFTNLANDVFLNGRSYRAVFTNLGSGSNTVTVNSNGNTFGFWTATLKSATQNNSVSEFSDPLVIQPQFPAGVGNGIALWMSADKGVTEVGGNDITEWKDRAGVHTPSFYNSDPDLLDDEANLINFNPTVDFDGNDFIRWDGDLFTSSFTAGEIFTVNKEGVGVGANNNFPYDMGGASSSHYTYSNNYIYDDFGSSDRKVWRPNTFLLSYTEGTTTGASLAGPIRNTLDYNIYNVLSEPSNWQSAFNGITAVTDVTHTVNFSTPSAPHLGARHGGVWTGRLPEIVFYNRVLDLDERQRVNSYLAIKYGLTLGHNYYASDWNGTTGTTLWTIGGGYDNDIAGVGRDDVGSIIQNQSKSINEDQLVTMYNEDQSAGFPVSNASNTDTATADKSFILWGNDDNIADFGIAYTPNSFTLPPGGFFFHYERIWKVAETGTIGTVTISIPAITGVEHLLVHNSDDFNTGTPDEYEMINDGNGNLYVVLDFNDGEFFTFGALKTAPGCVPLGLSLWLKPDLLPAGNMTNGIGWSDVSGNDNDFTAVTSDPSTTIGNKNFNNTVYFDGGDYLTQPTFTNAFTAGEVFTSTSTTSNAGNPYFFGGQNNDHYRVDNIYVTFGTTNRMGWTSSNGNIIDGHPGLAINHPPIFDPEVWGIFNVYAEAGNIGASHDGFLKAYSSNNTVSFANPNNRIGSGNYDNYTGDIGDVILYNRVLSTNERERVNTYLALKYGTTLHHDYLLGDGTMLWDSSALALYHNDVAGIIRDKCQGLHQRQSISQNENVILSIYNGDHLSGLPTTNLTNPSNLNTDESAMLWGNNGLSSSYGAPYTLVSVTENCFYRMDRVWQIQETGTVGTVTVQAPTDAMFLLVHTNDAFGLGTVEVPLTNGRATYDFSDGDFFTFGSKVQAPGGVVADLEFWLKADAGIVDTADGVNVDTWEDQSSNKYLFSDNGQGGPIYSKARAINFNPTVEWTAGATQEVISPTTMMPQGPVTEFAVAAWDVPSTSADAVIDFCDAGTNDNEPLFGFDDFSVGMFDESSNSHFHHSGTVIAGQALTMDATFTHGVSGIILGHNGDENSSSNTISMVAGNSRVSFGNPAGGDDRVLDGLISEGIGYSRELTTIEKQKVRTYLGVKYGTTIEDDYISSSGTLLWDSSAMDIYHNNIAAIARDDCSGLHQKQSKSVGSTEIVTVFNGNQSSGFPQTNIANTAALAADLSFMLWGSTDSTTAYTETYTPSSFTLPVGVSYYHMKRVWKVAEVGGTVGTVTVSIPTNTRAEHILIHNSDDFSAGTPTELVLQDDGNGNLYAIVDLTDGQYFTFGFAQKSPGCVGAGLQLWLLPDNLPVGALANGAGWSDNSLLLNDFTTVTATPSLVENGVNFNNYVEFNPGDRLSKPSISSGFTAGEVFSMLQTNSINTAQGHGFFFGGDAQGGSHYTWNNAAVYEHFGTSDRLAWNPSTAGIVESKTGATTNSAQTFNVRDWNIYNVRSETGLWEVDFNGFKQATSATNVIDFSGTNNYIGYSGTSNWNGNNAETILYNRVLTDTERKQVNTYIAVKYGKTLFHDYVAGDGVVLWDYTSLATYHNNVAGIGRDDCGGFNQKQSKSLNDNAVITMGNVSIRASNALNVNNILDDKTYLLWGHDNAGFTFQTSDMPSAGLACGGRIAQEWKVQERGDIDDVSLQFGGTDFSVPASATGVSLFIDTDGNGDFTNGSPTIVEPDSVSGGIAYFSSLDFSQDDVFTFGWSQAAPGGLASSNTAWFKANEQVFNDAGVTLIDTTGANNVQEWHDVSGNTAFVGNQPRETAVGDKASYVLNGVNFNPTINFLGANDRLRTPNTINSDDIRAVAGQASTAYVVGNSSSGADQVFFDHGDPSNTNFVFATSRLSMGQDPGITYTNNVGSDFQILSGVRSGSGFSQAYLDGVENGSVTAADISGENDIFSIGINTVNTADLIGNVAEIIIFKNGHTDLERERVQSYLAIKYGITMQHDYVSSASTLLWDSSALATYHNDVAGIGQDSCSGLFQKQSISQNSDAIVTMYHGNHVGFLPNTNAANPEEFTANNSFLIWGNNDQPITYTGSYPTNTYLDIMERVWHVEETGIVGNITLTVDEAQAVVLIVDADGDFTDGNSVEYSFSNGEILHDFNDGDYFTFGSLICKDVATVACATSFDVDLTAYISGFTPGGTWTDVNSSGVDLSDPTDVDFSGAALGNYTYKYVGLGGTCDNVNVERLVAIPAPIVADILICEGGVTEITVPTPADREIVLWEENFSGNAGYQIRSRCSGPDVSNCHWDNSSTFANVGLKLDPGTNFAAWYSWYYSWVWSSNSYMGFGRMRDQQISLTTDSAYTLLPGETMNFSGQSARWWGGMEADDYVKFSYVVDGVETEFASRNGTISGTLQTSSGNYTNISASPQQVEMRVKVKNSWNEGHYIDNFKMSKILAPPTFTFYDDAGLTTVLATGLSYDPMTAAGTTSIVYVTRTENGCESVADMVTVEVSPNNVTPMAGEAAFYCAGGSTVDLTAHISNYQAGGTWADTDGSGVSLVDPTAVDVSGLAAESYNFIYTLSGVAPCSGEQAMVTINVGLQPGPPVIDDIIACDGASTIISITPAPDEQEVLYDQAFNGYNGGYNLLGRCTSDDVSTCRRDNLANFNNRGLTVDTSATDFANWTRWATWVYDYSNLRFGRLMDEEIVLSTDSFTLLDGEVANFSGDSRRYFGTLETGDYVKFFYVVDGVETEFDSRDGNISTAFSTSNGVYENTSGTPENIQLRVKVKNSWAEAHIIDNLKITKTLNKPTYKFYSDYMLTTLIVTGNNYDPATTAGNTDIVYVTRFENGCESIADTVEVTISTNNISPMEGDEMYYCSGTSTDLTSLVTTYVAGGNWTDLDTSGVDMSDSTSVDFSAVGAGTYNFAYKLAGSCADEEVIVTVHIGILGGTPYVVNDGAVATSLTECREGNWIYFVDPNDDSRRIVAINTNGNTISPSAFSVMVDVDAPSTDLERASGSGATGKAVRLMRRQVQINCATCGTLSPAVDVRLYWETGEKTTTENAMDSLMTANSITGTKQWQWFKVSHDVSAIPGNLDSDGITDNSGNGLTWSAADASGTESNGVGYVQFNGITTFSTFGGGFSVNQPDGSLLPVELLYIEAKAIDNKFIQLDWATATEINNEGFEIQRSIDGENFETIDWMEGNGNSQKTIQYSLNDYKVSASILYYYRLKQVDFDGNFDYSEIVSAKIISGDGLDIKLIPNPSAGDGKISINSSSETTVELKIYGNMGQLILSKSLVLIKGLNEFDIDLESYSSGSYNVMIYGENNSPTNLKWVLIK